MVNSEEVILRRITSSDFFEIFKDFNINPVFDATSKSGGKTMCSRFNNNRLIENRQIRVFLSSTFSDMDEERSALVKRFEKLKIEASRRNVVLSVVDLRWGVTPKEARSGKVLSVCLNEIENSHPFFIGLLGNRYGCSPLISDIKKNPELKERYPWIEKDIVDGLSITEIEMQYGVLRNTDESDAAFFIKQSDLPDDNPKLTALKATIRSQNKYLVADYSTVEQLCEQVENELRRILNRHFPEMVFSQLEREKNSQRAYINSFHAHYVSRQCYFDIIDRFVHSDEHYLVITGESGIGKSALIANWIKENEDNGDFNLFYHFVGNSFSNNNYENILIHLCNEITKLYQLENRAGENETIVEEAGRIVNLVAQKEVPLVIIIDGINQITAKNNEKLLLWLPASNNKVKFIFSTLQGDETMRAFEQRGYRIETITPLPPKERKQFVRNYLAFFGKHLTDNQLRCIVNDSENENTLVLKTLLDELICFGSFGQLDARIDYYLSASSTSVFFDRVLARMEDDYSAGQNLVSHTLTLIALSECGLAEDELITILGCRQLDWHLFFCAFFNHFIVKDGLITFAHQYISNAVINRYCIYDCCHVIPFRQEIVSYFLSRPSDDEVAASRCLSELAHQYYCLSDWEKLYGLLIRFDAFDYFYRRNQYLLARYWRAVIGVDKKYSISAFLDLCWKDDDSILASKYYDIGFFIQDCISDYQLALKFYNRALKIQKQVLNQDDPDIAATYNNMGYIYESTGDFDKALKYYSKSLAVRKKVLGDNVDTAESYNNIGSVYDSMGYYEDALAYYNESLKIFENVCGERHSDLATVFSNVALLYCCLGKYKKAEKYFDKALKIDQEVLGLEHPDTASSYDNICAVFDSRGEYKKSLEFHFKALAIRRKIFGEDHPDVASSYNCLGGVYSEIGAFDKAMKCYMKALKIRKEVLGREHLETATCYNNIGAIYDSLCDYKIAIACYFESLEIFQKRYCNQHPDIALCYNNIGTAYYSLGDYKKALRFHGKALSIRKRFFGIESLETACSYDNIGMVYLCLDEGVRALEYCQKALNIFEKQAGANHLETAVCYNNIGAIFSRQGCFDKAMEYQGRALAIRSKILGDTHPDTLLVKENINKLMDKINSM